MQSVFVESISFLCGENPSLPVKKQGRKWCRLKGLCCYWQHKTARHRQAKPSGGFRLGITFQGIQKSLISEKIGNGDIERKKQKMVEYAAGYGNTGG